MASQNSVSIGPVDDFPSNQVIVSEHMLLKSVQPYYHYLKHHRERDTFAVTKNITSDLFLMQCTVIYLNIGYSNPLVHDDDIKWKPSTCYWPFVRGELPMDSPHKGQWRGALMFSLICVWINGWVIVRLVIWDAIALIMTSS